MTKPRRPLTAHRALTRIADRLGWDGCAEALGLSDWSIRKWADPDAGREISFRNAIRLDAAYLRAGGETAPLLECYAARVDLMTEGAAVAGCLLGITARAAKEAGDAVAAALASAARAQDAALRARAEVEALEGIEALQSLLFRLRQEIPPGRTTEGSGHGNGAVPVPPAQA